MQLRAPVDVTAQQLGVHTIGGVVTDENLGLVFPARVKLVDATLMIDGAEVRLTPGMSLSVEIKTGKRRVIDYLLSPLKQHGTQALRER